jgi:hypothetical protein
MHPLDVPGHGDEAPLAADYLSGFPYLRWRLPDASASNGSVLRQRQGRTAGRLFR